MVDGTGTPIGRQVDSAVQWLYVGRMATAEKVGFLPKIKIEPARRAVYEKALRQFQRDTGMRDVKFAAWVRRACDAQAAKDLGADHAWSIKS